MYNITCLYLPHCLSSCDYKRLVFSCIFYCFVLIFYWFLVNFLALFVLLVSLCLHKLSKLIEFVNFWNKFMYMFASSLFDGGHLSPAFVIPLLRVSLCLFTMVHSLIRYSVLWEPFWQGHVGSSIFF